MRSTHSILSAAAVLAAFSMAAPASADVPAFNAECPLDINVFAEGDGNVYVNGKAARVERFNANYYEAKSGGITISIAIDNGSLILSYTAPGGANGVCTVSGQASGGSTGTSSEPETTTQPVYFPTGSSGTEIPGVLTPGSSARYVLGAKNGQFLYVRVDHRGGPRTEFQIFNPDGSFLLEMIPTDKEYRGQLWQSGEHIVEVINRGGATADYKVIFGID